LTLTDKLPKQNGKIYPTSGDVDNHAWHFQSLSWVDWVSYLVWKKKEKSTLSDFSISHDFLVMGRIQVSGLRLVKTIGLFEMSVPFLYAFSNQTQIYLSGERFMYLADWLVLRY